MERLKTSLVGMEAFDVKETNDSNVNEQYLTEDNAAELSDSGIVTHDKVSQLCELSNFLKHHHIRLLCVATLYPKSTRSASTMLKMVLLWRTRSYLTVRCTFSQDHRRTH